MNRSVHGQMSKGRAGISGLEESGLGRNLGSRTFLIQLGKHLLRGAWGPALGCPPPDGHSTQSICVSMRHPAKLCMYTYICIYTAFCSIFFQNKKQVWGTQGRIEASQPFRVGRVGKAFAPHFTAPPAAGAVFPRPHLFPGTLLF